MDLSKLNASNGSGEAVQASVTTIRTAGSTTIAVDFLTNWPAKFIATTGKLVTISGTTQQTIDPTTVMVFAGHTSGATIVIDTIAPGYTDHGNSVADIVVIKPTTLWADTIQAAFQVAHNNDGTLKTNTVGATQITDGTVGTAELASAAVTPVKWTNPYKFRAYLNQAMTSNSADQIVLLNAVNFDSNSNFNTTTNRYVAPVAGFYQFSGTVSTAGGSYILPSIFKNGSVYSYGPEVTSGGGSMGANITDIIQLSAGDYVQFGCNAITGKAYGTGSGVTWFGGFLISQT